MEKISDSTLLIGNKNERILLMQLGAQNLGGKKKQALGTNIKVENNKDRIIF